MIGDFEKSSKVALIEKEETGSKVVKRKTTEERIAGMLAGAAAKADESGTTKGAGECMRAATPIIVIVVKALQYIGPFYIKVFNVGHQIYLQAPKNVIKITFGAALCGFGGTFAASIAAIEAFNQMGGEKVFTTFEYLWGELKTIQKKNETDDQVDADKNGIADADELLDAGKFADYASRKITVTMTAVKQPEKLQEAVVGLWAAYMAVLATLRLEFARTTAMAMGIIDVVEPAMVRVLAEPVSKLLGKDLAHWAHTILDSAIKIVAIIFAWYLQMIISAFYSALRGGRMIADGLCAIISEKGWTELELPIVGKALKGAADPETSYLDEAILYPCAAVGFSYQILVGFALPFPLNLLLLPLSIVEWFLRWQITMTSGAGADAGAASG
jgi:hypothetical protein